MLVVYQFYHLDFFFALCVRWSRIPLVPRQTEKSRKYLSYNGLRMENSVCVSRLKGRHNVSSHLFICMHENKWHKQWIHFILLYDCVQSKSHIIYGESKSRGYNQDGMENKAKKKKNSSHFAQNNNNNSTATEEEKKTEIYRTKTKSFAHTCHCDIMLPG